jgi:hypothetical protein
VSEADIRNWHPLGADEAPAFKEDVGEAADLARKLINIYDNSSTSSKNDLRGARFGEPTSLELQLFSQIELLAKPSGDFGEPLFALDIELRPIAD